MTSAADAMSAWVFVGADASGEDGHDRLTLSLPDKDDLAVRRVMTGVGWAAAISEQFDECVNWVYTAALMWAKYFARDDPWSTKVCDRDTKREPTARPLPFASRPRALTGCAKRSDSPP